MPIIKKLQVSADIVATAIYRSITSVASNLQKKTTKAVFPIYTIQFLKGLCKKRQVSYDKLCMLFITVYNNIFRSRLRVFDMEDRSLCGRGSMPFNPLRLVFPRCTKPTKPLALQRQAEGFDLVI